MFRRLTVIFDITDDPDINKRIPRFITIMDQKVTTEWREALSSASFVMMRDI